MPLAFGATTSWSAVDPLLDHAVSRREASDESNPVWRDDAPLAHQEGIGHQLKRPPIHFRCALIAQRGEPLVKARVFARHAVVECHDGTVDLETPSTARELERARARLE